MSERARSSKRRTTSSRSPRSCRASACEKSLRESKGGASTSSSARATRYRTLPTMCEGMDGRMPWRKMATSETASVASQPGHDTDPSPSRKTLAGVGGPGGSALGLLGGGSDAELRWINCCAMARASSGRNTTSARSNSANEIRRRTCSVCANLAPTVRAHCSGLVTRWSGVRATSCRV